MTQESQFSFNVTGLSGRRNGFMSRRMQLFSFPNEHGANELQVQGARSLAH